MGLSLDRITNKKLLGDLYKTGVIYPTVSNLSYFWNFGVLALVCLLAQIITGIFLAMHYTPEQGLAFSSVEHIMRDVNMGWLIRYLHSNGASMFFIVVYIHIFRGLYYGSYLAPREGLWLVGVIILLLMILTAFMGYVLPWGQMSFWGATVITNLVSAIPKIGSEIVVWLWGGYSINNATLNRFFSLHYLFPFVIFGLVGIHLILLHTDGSNNPLGISLRRDVIPFYPYYIIKDLYGIIVFLMFFLSFVFFNPNTLGHPDNYIAANPMVTPAHIVPEWYFLPFYAILRSIPDKLMGVVCLVFGIVVLFFLPFIIKTEIRSNDFRPLANLLFWFFVVDTIILCWVGSKPVEEPYVGIAQISTSFYFGYFLIFLPVISLVEKYLLSPSSKG